MRSHYDWDDPDDYGLDYYDEPPLYKDGYLAGLTPGKLIAERNRQSDIHDSAVDRCEEINSPTIETAQVRHDLCAAELRRRGLSPWADSPEPLLDPMDRVNGKDRT